MDTLDITTPSSL